VLEFAQLIDDVVGVRTGPEEVVALPNGAEAGLLRALNVFDGMIAHEYGVLRCDTQPVQRELENAAVRFGIAFNF
jgi:hypothetical protein